MVGRERLGAAAGGGLADAAIGRNDRQRLGVRVLGDELLDPRVGVLIAECEEDAESPIVRIEPEVAGGHRGIEDHRGLPGDVRPQRGRELIEKAAARAAKPLAAQLRPEPPPACITLYPSMSQRMSDEIKWPVCLIIPP